MLRIGSVAAAMLAGTAVAVIAAAPATAQKKDPPACAAISFRPIPAGMPDGEQDAGLYKSRFARIEIKAQVRNGQPETYYMLLNGKKPAPISGPLPKAVEPCLQAKHVKLPVKAQDGNCTGTRFRVVIDSSGPQKLAMLFGLHGNDWRYCSAAAM